MIVCVCNNLNEDDINNISMEEWNCLKSCGICKETVEKILTK
jgi:uncharacterized protein YuzB (UPF0349 family)